MTADPWRSFLATRRASNPGAEELALIACVESLADIAETCERGRREGPTINRTWLVQRIREALTALATNLPKENKRG